MINAKKKREIYKCNICGNIVEMLHVGGGELVCCGKPMELMVEKTNSEGHEKHVPVIERAEGKIILRIGSTPHPMPTEHYIEWAEIIVDGTSYKKFLTPNDLPEATFAIYTNDKITARVYCNIHGLWKAEE